MQKEIIALSGLENHYIVCSHKYNTHQAFVDIRFDFLSNLDILIFSMGSLTMILCSQTDGIYKR